MTTRVVTEVTGRVATVTLADEEHRNALSDGLVAEFTAALDELDADPDVTVVVITNRGRFFCAGADLNAARNGPPAVLADPGRLFGRFARSGKIYVGRIAGHCVAGGMGLAAALDIAVAADDATFGFTEVRVGVAPAVISVVCLPKMRPADARAAFLRGRRFAAAEAARLGLITSAVPRDRLDAEVDAILDDLLAGGPGALAATKALLREVPALPANAAFRWTGTLSAELFDGDEAKEGMAAFLEKRPASWVPLGRERRS